MNTVAKNTDKKATKSFKPKKTFNPKFAKKKPIDNRPPLAIMVFDLTSRATDAKIIRIFQLIVHEDGETEASSHLFNNGTHAISEEAFKYHGINADDLADKPDASTFDFCQAKNVVVWDGQVTRSIFRHNKITKFSPLINLHALARYLEPIQNSISLNKYALKANPARKHILEFQLKKIENKVIALHDIYKHICLKYKEVHDENRPAFLVALGKTPDKKKFLATIDAYMKKRQEIQARIKHKPSDEKSTEQPTKKVIVVNASQGQSKQGVKAVVVVKRKKD